MARDPRRDRLGRDRDILLQDREETLLRLETVSRPGRLDRDHIPVRYQSKKSFEKKSFAKSTSLHEKVLKIIVVS